MTALFLLRALFFPGLLFAACFGLFLVWVMRKVVARVQWRVGPPIFQPFADFFKLIFKETVIPLGAHRKAFVSAPVLALASILVASLLIPGPASAPVLGFGGDLLVLLYLLTFFAVALVVGGMASGNPLSSTGAGREMALVLSYELSFALCLLVPAVGAGSLRIEDIVRFSLSKGPIYFLPAAVVFFVCMLAKMGLPPFDIPEAKTELMAGIYTEYSGSLLGLLKLSKAIQLYVLSSLLVSLYFPSPSLGVWPIDAALHLAKVVLVVAVLSVLAAANPRARIDPAFKICWLYLMVPVLANLVVCLVLF